MRKRTVLVVEDEPAIRRGIVDILTVSGFDVSQAADGRSGLEAACSSGPDIVLLDLMLPEMDGVEVLRQIRERFPSLPVIILTARGGEDDRVKGLKIGADDYVVKPFSPRELLARVEAVLRRSPERPSPALRLREGEVLVDCDRHEVIGTEGRQATLSDMEVEVLRRLGSLRDRAVSREELLSTIWGIRDGRVETRAIDMHITRLRNKLVSCGASDGWIVTVRGRGYMLGTGITVESSDEPAVDLNADPA